MVQSIDDRSETVEVPDDPDDVDEQQFLEWMDNHGEAIQDVLSEMTAIYHKDDEKKQVRNTDISHVNPHGDYVGVQFDLPNEMDPDVEGANILRLLDDLCAHEVAHLNYTPLESKQEFAECYPGFGQMAGGVANILEDEYIDAERQREYYGMREKLAYYVWLHMNTEERAPDVDEIYDEHGIETALMAALNQFALAGYVNGIEDAPDEIAGAMAEVEPFIDRVREAHDPQERELLMHATMNTLAKYVPDPEEYDPDDVDDRRDGNDTPKGPPESPDSDKPEMELPDEMQDALEELMDDIADEIEEMEPDEAPPMPDAEEMPVNGGDMGEMAPDDAGGSGDSDEDGDDTTAGDGGEESETGDGDDEPESLADLFGDGADGDTDADGDADGDTDDTESDTADDTGDTAGDGGGDGDTKLRDVESYVDEYGADRLTVQK